ncbi:MULTISPECIES: diguanylate cyclase domain-containing protein [unclassified Sphingomonas]|jgi:GGDEF domain-containing protein|uniref:diguanylate cyclase domain-containing protein n=1 Tax=unclassified Sphingomonas TaxID=196159 RepID=UPI000E10C819|nr:MULTISPECIES: diguanylate cyclase [unclassified Sphingomonas]AXJ96308.1 hypothetical protein DM480_13180 [Sphingomonas sp. FARSPH]
MPGARAIAHLRESGYRDALTGLRKHAWLAAHVAAWATPGTGVAIIGLDHFKQIKDTLGHTGGDAVLAQTRPDFRASPSPAAARRSAWG